MRIGNHPRERGFDVSQDHNENYDEGGYSFHLGRFTRPKLPLVDQCPADQIITAFENVLEGRAHPLLAVLGAEGVVVLTMHDKERLLPSIERLLEPTASAVLVLKNADTVGPKILDLLKQRPAF